MKIFGYEVTLKKAPIPLEDREPKENKIGVYREFYGNLVKIIWVDHWYVTIKMVECSQETFISLSCPRKDHIPHNHTWVDKMKCLTPVVNRRLKIIKEKLMSKEYIPHIKERTPLTKEQIDAMSEKLYSGELRDLAHLKGVRMVYEGLVPKQSEDEEI